MNNLALLYKVVFVHSFFSKGGSEFEVEGLGGVGGGGGRLNRA